MTVMRATLTAASMLAVLALAACGNGDAAPVEQGDPTGPLEALPACAQPPEPTTDEVRGLLLPEGAVVTSVQEQGPVTNVTGYVRMTPVAFEKYYADGDLNVLISENEIYEAELLVSDGEFRNFFKATATCRDGADVLVVVAPEVDAEGLPVPQGLDAATPAP